MGWQEIKQKARDDVHRTFVLPALFTRGMDAAVPCNARMHYKVRRFGDMDREGFATVVEDIDYVILDTRELAMIVENDTIEFPGIGRLFKLTIREPWEDQTFQKWQVTEI